MSRSASTITKDLTKVYNRAATLMDELDDARKRKLIKCESCQRATKVSTLTYLQTHFYVQPHGCTGGDYWREGEGQFVCPKCNATNRLYDRPDVSALKKYFMTVEEVYDR